MLMKTKDYKKLTVHECDYCWHSTSKCRSKKCTHYKKAVKSFLKNRKKEEKLLYNYLSHDTAE